MGLGVILEIISHRFSNEKFSVDRIVNKEFYILKRTCFIIRERERKKKFCVINVKYKEISWRVRKGRGGEEGGKK